MPRSFREWIALLCWIGWLLPVDGLGSLNGVAVVVSDPTSAHPVEQAYVQGLKEIGVAPVVVSERVFLKAIPAELASRYAAVIFPDTIARKLTSGIESVVGQYLAAGGAVAVVHDAGTLNESSHYLDKGVFSEVLGVSYALTGGSFSPIRFTPEGSVFWDLPPGKLARDGTLEGYAYGALSFPLVSSHRLGHRSGHSSGVRVDAMSTGSVPVVAVRGRAVWINPPIGVLKSRGDGFLLHELLRGFLSTIAQMPRLLPAPDGIGTLVWNWHVDSNVEHRALPRLRGLGLLRRTLTQDFHITAGPDCVRLGDGQGFDLDAPAGRRAFQAVSDLGPFGSHGGWTHDWFAEQLRQGALSESQVEKYIALNVGSIKRASGSDIGSYSAPEGTHPQPMLTRILEKFGIRSYYYLGDQGSAPTLTFHEGAQVSESAWAFPVLGLGKWASLGEFCEQARYSEAKVEDWYRSLTSWLSRNATIRLVYSHPNDLLICGWEKMFGRVLDRFERASAAGAISFERMSTLSEFLSRHRVAQVEVRREADGTTTIVAEQTRLPGGLRDFAIEIPVSRLPSSNPRVSGTPADCGRRSETKWVCRIGGAPTRALIRIGGG